MRSLIMLVLVVVMLVPQHQKVLAASSFKDVPLSHKYYDEIMTLAEDGVINGYENGAFLPSNTITRKQVAVMLYRASQQSLIDLTPTRPSKNFKDVQSTDKAVYDAIDTLYRAGVIDGTSETTFEPNKTLTRKQMAKILVNTFSLTLEENSVLQFTDVKDDWAKGYIDILSSVGITTGSNGKFAPDNYVTREHFVVFMYRALTKEASGLRSDPVPVGQTKTVDVRVYDNQWEGYLAKVDITFADVLRGQEAYSQIKAYNEYNDEPKPGYEYVAVYVEARMTASETDNYSWYADESDFEFVSKDGSPYESTPVDFEPTFNGDVYNGGTLSGYIFGQVKQNDEIFVVFEDANWQNFFFEIEEETLDFTEETQDSTEDIETPDFTEEIPSFTPESVVLLLEEELNLPDNMGIEYYGNDDGNYIMNIYEIIEYDDGSTVKEVVDGIYFDTSTGEYSYISG